MTTEVVALAAVPNWQAMLRHGLGAEGIGSKGEKVAEAIESRRKRGLMLSITHKSSCW